jgi:hypothetical protein
MKKFFSFLLTLTPFLGIAHPGHGETEGFTIKHYFVEPGHIVFSILALAIIIFFLGRSKEMRDVKKQNQQ